MSAPIVIDGHPRVEHVGGARPWRMARPLRAWSQRIRQPITVPEGYRSDLASVPRIPGVYALAGGRATVPALLHDALYEGRGGGPGGLHPLGITRRQADLIFRDAMAALDDPPNPATRWIMYLGVRLGGWRGWRGREQTGKEAA